MNKMFVYLLKKKMKKEQCLLAQIPCTKTFSIRFPDFLAVRETINNDSKQGNSWHQQHITTLQV